MLPAEGEDMKKLLTVLLLLSLCALLIFGSAACGGPSKQGTDTPAQDQDGTKDEAEDADNGQGGELNPPDGDGSGEVKPPDGGDAGEVTPPDGDGSGEVKPPDEGDGGEVTPPDGDGSGEVTPPDGGDNGEVTPPVIAEDEALKRTQAYAVWRRYLDGITAQAYESVAMSVYPKNTLEYQNFLDALDSGDTNDPVLAAAINEMKGAVIGKDYVTGGKISDGQALIHIIAEINGETYAYDVALYQSMLDGNWYFDSMPSILRGCLKSQEKEEFEFTAESAALVWVRYHYITLEVPSNVNGVPVTQIKAGAFGSGNEGKAGKLISFVIPNSVTQIEKGALYGCSKLAGGSALTTLTLPFLGINAIQKGCLGNVFGADSYLQNEAYVPASLETVSVHGGTIWERAFAACDYIREVVLGKEVGVVEKSSFTECAALSKVYLGESVTRIGEKAFSKCYRLTEVTFAENSNLNTIENAAFELCRNLTGIRFPKKLKTVGTGAFRQCAVLGQITFGEKIETIGDSAFESCGLVTVTVQGNPEIGYGVFEGCANLERVLLQSQQTLILSDDFFAVNDDFGIYVQESLLYEYQSQYMMYESRFFAIA